MDELQKLAGEIKPAEKINNSDNTNSQIDQNNMETVNTESTLQKIFSSTPGKVILGGIGVLGILGVMLGAIFLLSLLRQEEEADIVSNDEEIRILSELIKANPELKSSLPRNVVEDAPENPEIPLYVEDNNTQDPNDPSNTLPIPIPDSVTGEIDPIDLSLGTSGEYNYRYTKKSTTKGPAYDSCDFYTFEDPNAETVIEEFYSYYDQNRSYYKWETETGQGDLLSRAITRYGNTENTFGTYANGDYGVVRLYEINEDFTNGNVVSPASYPPSNPESYPPSNPTSFPPSYPEDQELVESYFGSNARVVDTEEIDGALYYIIEVEYYSYCQGANNKVIYRYTANSEDFSLDSISTYFNSISDDNLIFTQEFLEEEKSTIFTGIESIFSFESGTTVREIDYASYTFDANIEFTQDSEYIQGANLQLLYKDDKDFELEWLYSKNFPESVDNEYYYRDRAYYADNEIGQSKYEDIVERLERQPLFEVFYSNDNSIVKNLSLNTFSLERTDEQIRNHLYANYFEGFAQGSMILDNQFLETRRWYQEYQTSNIPSYPASIGVSYPTSYSVSGGVQYATVYNVLEIFDENNYTYTASSYSLPTLGAIRDEGLNQLNPNDKDASFFDQMIDRYREIEQRYTF